MTTTTTNEWSVWAAELRVTAARVVGDEGRSALVAMFGGGLFERFLLDAFILLALVVATCLTARRTWRSFASIWSDTIDLIASVGVNLLRSIFCALVVMVLARLAYNEYVGLERTRARPDFDADAKRFVDATSAFNASNVSSSALDALRHYFGI